MLTTSASANHFAFGYGERHVPYRETRAVPLDQILSKNSRGVPQSAWLPPSGRTSPRAQHKLEARHRIRSSRCSRPSRFALRGG